MVFKQPEKINENKAAHKWLSPKEVGKQSGLITQQILKSEALTALRAGKRYPSF
jgi:ATP-dependent protease ClpP protease subunit